MVSGLEIGGEKGEKDKSIFDKRKVENNLIMALICLQSLVPQFQP